MGRDTLLKLSGEFGQDLFPLGNWQQSAKKHADTKRRPMALERQRGLVSTL
jgi:hypothetical protein